MQAGLLDLGWFVRLRWAFAGVQALLVAGSAAGAVPWALAPMAVALVVGSASNAALGWAARAGRAREAGVLATLLLDAALLTVLLAVAGGASNALVPLYIVPPVLGASLLSPRGAWGIVAATGALYGGLFLWGPPPEHNHGHEAMRWHTLGMFAAWGLGGPIVVYAVSRARAALALADERTAEARTVAERAERLASLATLSAGAAHELGTPLSTILVSAREIERAATDPRVRDDAAAIQEEVQRCRDVLTDLCADTGASRAEQGEWVAVRDLLDEALDPPLEGPVATDSGPRAEDLVRLPVRPVVLALRRLLGNAIDANPRGPVALRAALDGDTLRLIVQDDGDGMDAAALVRATEPFYTTKPTGRGLGLFYVESVARGLGGRLTFTSRPGVGTTAELALPRVPVRPADEQDA